MPRIDKDSLIEGYYIETIDGLFFTVKGIHHPDDSVIAYLRYLPDPNGLRKKNGYSFTRLYDLSYTTEILREKYSQYIRFIESKGMELQAVPLDAIKRIYNPIKKLSQILVNPKTPLELLTSRFVAVLTSEVDIDELSLGISGSVLIGLDKCTSDLDLVVYGMKPGYRIYEGLRTARKNSDWINSYDHNGALRISKTRWGDSGIDITPLINIEKEKILQGLVENRDYFLRLVRKPEEWEKELKSEVLGDIVLEGKVMDAEECIFTPCSYKIYECKTYPKNEHAVSELVSYRGKFTEQVEEGDKIRAKGSLEKVSYNNRTTYRLMLGRKNDYFIPIKNDI